MKRKNKTSTDWQCSVRSKTVKCRATVKEKNGTFIEGPQPHCHQPQAESLAKTKIAVQVKANAKANMFKSAGRISCRMRFLKNATCSLQPKTSWINLNRPRGGI